MARHHRTGASLDGFGTVGTVASWDGFSYEDSARKHFNEQELWWFEAQKYKLKGTYYTDALEDFINSYIKRGYEAHGE